MTHGKTYNKSPRTINHKATKCKTNTGTSALERSVEQTTGGFKALLQLANFTLGPDATLNTEIHKNSVRIKAPHSVKASKRKHKNQISVLLSKWGLSGSKLYISVFSRLIVLVLGYLMPFMVSSLAHSIHLFCSSPWFFFIPIDGFIRNICFCILFSQKSCNSWLWHFLGILTYILVCD